MYLSSADVIYDNTDDTSEIPVFLDIDKLIEIALKTNADAIHPGYGFLAENAYFAQKCIDKKIIFIGPSPDAIYKMGNKTIARKIANSLNIPMAMGSEGNICNEEEAVVIAEKIGYPVIIKSCIRRRRKRYEDCTESLMKWRKCSLLPAKKLKKHLMIHQFSLKNISKTLNILNFKFLEIKRGM